MKRTTHLFDAKGKILGRFATDIALVLSGRRKVDYTPNIDGGDMVVVVNSDHIRVTGGKDKKKLYHNYSGYPGGMKTLEFRQKMEDDSRKVIVGAIYGMLPKNKLRDKMLKRLRVFKDDKHPHQIEEIHA